MIDIDYPAALFLVFHILCSAGLLFPLLLPQHIVNAFADLLYFLNFVFQRGVLTG